MNRYKISSIENPSRNGEVTEEALSIMGKTLQEWLADNFDFYGENPDVVAEIDTSRIADLWQQADDLANSIADQNARARFLAWLIDPATPTPAKDLIAQLQAAMDSIWAQYAAGKAAILAGNEPERITATANLPTFWDVAAAAAQ